MTTDEKDVKKRPNKFAQTVLAVLAFFVLVAGEKLLGEILVCTQGGKGHEAAEENRHQKGIGVTRIKGKVEDFDLIKSPGLQGETPDLVHDPEESPGNIMEQKAQSGQRPAEKNDHLNNIRPHDGLETPDGRENGR